MLQLVLDFLRGELINCKIVLDILEGQKWQGWVFKRSATHTRQQKHDKQQKKQNSAETKKEPTTTSRTSSSNPHKQQQVAQNSTNDKISSKNIFPAATKQQQSSKSSKDSSNNRKQQQQKQHHEQQQTAKAAAKATRTARKTAHNKKSQHQPAAKNDKKNNTKKQQKQYKHFGRSKTPKVGGEGGRRSAAPKQQQAQAAATGTQATRKAATSSRIKSRHKHTNNNPETVRAVRRRGVPRRVPEGWCPEGGAPKSGAPKGGGPELARKKSHFRWFLLRLRQPSYGTQRMEFYSSSGGVGSTCPGATPQVGSVVSSFERRKPQQPRVPGTDPQQGRWRQPHLSGQKAYAPNPAFKPSRAPKVVVADAVADVQRLEAAIAVLGGDNVHAKDLQEAFRVARSKTKVPPISERVEACKTFVEKAKKRVQRAQEVMDKALAQRIVHEEEVAEVERRLALLQAEVATPGPDPIVQVTQLQQQTDSLVRERDALRANAVAATVPQDKPAQWMGNGPPSAENIPPMAANLQDLEGWFSDRNCELRNAMEFGNPGLVGQIGHLIGLGARQLEISRDQSNVPMNGQGKSSMMAARIDQADAKRRCIEATQLDGSQV